MTEFLQYDALRTEELIPHVRTGNHDAWREVYRRYKTFLMIAAGEAVGKIREDADDVLQSAFLSAWKDIEKFSYKGDGSLRSWLRKIVVNKNLTKLRKLNGSRPVTNQDSMESDWIEKLEDRSRKGPAEGAGARDSQALLMHFVETRLKPLEREILMLRYFEHLTTVQVAEIVELDSSSVNRHYKAAMAAMAEGMGSEDPGE